MIVVIIELWPGGCPDGKRQLGEIVISNDGSGTTEIGNYEVVASHAGNYFGKRPEPYKRGSVSGFARKLSPYRLLCRALHAIRET